MRSTDSPRLLLRLAGAALLGACTTATDVQVVRYPEASGVAPREASCAVELLEWSAVPAAGCRDVGDVFVGHSPLSLVCSRESAEAAIRAEGCRLGADLALVRAIADPETLCNSMRARLLRCDGGAGSP